MAGGIPNDCPTEGVIETQPAQRDGINCGDPAIDASQQGAPVVAVGVTPVQACPPKEQEHYHEQAAASGSPETIIIPDGVLGFSVTVIEGPEGCDPTAPTITGPNSGPTPLPKGFTMEAGAQSGTRDDVLNGPHTVDIPDGSCVIASWTVPAP